MEFIPAFIMFLLSIYSQVGPGLGIPTPDMNYGEIHFKTSRHLLETSTVAPAPVDEGFFAQVSTFYSDNNNMAMFLVLPIIVLLYGGCSSIYCISKCRRYLKKRRHKKLKRDDEEKLTDNEPNDLDQDSGNHETKSSKNINPAFERENSTPLPWQVPEDTTKADVHAPVKKKLIDDKYDNDRKSMSSALNPEKNKSQHRESEINEINRPPIPVEMMPLNSRENSEIPSRHLPPVRKPQSDKARFPDIDDPSPFTPPENPSLRNIDTPDGSQPKKVFRAPNQAFIDAAMRPRSDGRDSVSTIARRDELLARFDAFSTFAMAKKAADILRVNANDGDKKEYMKRKNKIIFIAE